jgi:hypothetical protein
VRIDVAGRFGPTSEQPPRISNVEVDMARKPDDKTKAAARKLTGKGTPARVHGDESERVAKRTGAGGPEKAQDRVSRTPPPRGSRTGGGKLRSSR